MPPIIKSFYLLVFFIFIPPVWAGDVIVSGSDSLRIVGERIRLWEIDTPELDQTCEAEGHETR